MKRKGSMIIAIVCLITMLCACGSDKGAENSNNEGASQFGQKNWEEEGYVVNPAETKVGLILTGTLGDESVHDQANAGLELVAESFGCETKYVECTDSAMYIDSIQGLCEAGYQLVCCDSFSAADALSTVAPSYPDVRFMILDADVEGENVTTFGYATQECSFLAGVVAAMTSKTGVIGFIGGMEIPTIKKFQVGFEEGVAYINPEAKVIAKYVGSDNSAWNDPATAKSLTLDAIANDADVCYHAAGASGMGMIEACVEKGVYGIGVNTDQSHLAPDRILTSAMTNGDRALYLFVENYLKGTPLSGTTMLNCANDGVGIVMSDLLEDDIKAKVEECRQKIISGEIQVTDVLAQ